jgi:hypothetical protein
MLVPVLLLIPPRRHSPCSSSRRSRTPSRTSCSLSQRSRTLPLHLRSLPLSLAANCPPWGLPRGHYLTLVVVVVILFSELLERKE